MGLFPFFSKRGKTRSRSFEKRGRFLALFYSFFEVKIGQIRTILAKFGQFGVILAGNRGS